ncbi:Imm53 family immunity protein [Achromobacter sp. MFA1 R4]|uniref:Imm53 family immunity protein n=1 Tax=Achromobacter sp. MFA1 R4 TaxID=1881016 RepID=UPI00095375C6|nr:Imm53 family immunity protein [Achromobacter sp. MFA1 R4]SIT29716.1 Immunity protein 53 [Achromobacter sp. MFA1 R4]
MTNLIETLQNWYTNKCDDVWEHSFGIEITNIDNPGWKVKITGTTSHIPFNINIERCETDWVIVNASDTVFEAFGGAANLSEILSLAVEWIKEEKT